MKNKIFLGYFMTITLMLWAKLPSGLQHYIEEASYTICYNTSNDNLEIDEEEENIPTTYDCDLPPQK